MPLPIASLSLDRRMLPSRAISAGPIRRCTHRAALATMAVAAVLLATGCGSTLPGPADAERAGAAAAATTPQPAAPVRDETAGVPEVMPASLAAAGPSATQDGRKAWFRAAKYGLFIHWGLYAIPAGVWEGKRVRISSEWIMAHARIPVRVYERLATRFDPVDFDAEAWVRLAQAAGMRYIVFTAKHGDGFAMYHSRVSPYNIVDATPFHRDPLRELADACARHGIRLGIYYSQSVDWHEPGGEGNSWDFPNDSAKDASGAYEHYLRGKVEPQIAELLTGYGPICEIFFDTPFRITQERGERIAALVHRLQPACLIDGRLGIPGDYATMGDNGIPSAAVGRDWETPGELNHNWGFDQNDSDYKAPSQVIFTLLDVVSKGGNYLLDVGPTASGRIPAVAAANLETVGRWLAVNGEAVYGTGASPFHEGFGGFGGFGRLLRDAAGRPVQLPFLDWRCTTRPGRIYLTLFHWPGETFTLPRFANPIAKAYLLDGDRHALPIQATAHGRRTITLPHYAPDVMATVLVLDIVGGAVDLGSGEH
jgi:alpha-L-fucosidase